MKNSKRMQIITEIQIWDPEITWNICHDQTEPPEPRREARQWVVPREESRGIAQRRALLSDLAGQANF